MTCAVFSCSTAVFRLKDGEFHADGEVVLKREAFDASEMEAARQHALWALGDILDDDAASED